MGERTMLQRRGQVGNFLKLNRLMWTKEEKSSLSDFLYMAKPLR
jgi:hypothetical protein